MIMRCAMNCLRGSLVVLVAAVVACGGITERVCEAGATQKCFCVEGGEGVQVCKEDGLGWRTCQGCGRPGDVASDVPLQPVDVTPQPDQSTPDTGEEPEDTVADTADTDSNLVDAMEVAEPELVLEEVQADTGGPLGTKDCESLTECVLACKDQACIDDCVAEGTELAQALFETLFSCVKAVCSGDQIFDNDCVVNAVGLNCFESYGYCTESCLPDCAGKQCGDNGCDGTCGDCPSPMVCENNMCIEVTVACEAEAELSGPADGCKFPSASCTCMGCHTDGDCDPNKDDCVCADCHDDAFCANPSNCDNNGLCDPWSEGCVCADCADHLSCP